MEKLPILEAIAWYQDATNLCAGQPIIPAANFNDLIEELVTYPEVTKTAYEMGEILADQTKRFSACGANNSDKWGVIRKNPKTGWQYIVDLITVE